MGDILFTGADDGLNHTEATPRKSRAGETKNCIIEKYYFCAFDVGRESATSWNILMPQDHYAMIHRRAGPTQFVCRY